MIRNTKRVFALLLALVMMTGLLPTPAFAREAEEPLPLPEQALPGPEEELLYSVPSTELTGRIVPTAPEMDRDLAGAFLEQELYALLPGAETQQRKNVGGNLSGINAGLYRELKSLIGQVARGEQSSTRLSVPLSQAYDGQTRWTESELGVPIVNEDGSFNQACMDAAFASFGLEMDLLLDSLLADCPYELYWYDKTKGTIASGPGFQYGRRGTECFLQAVGNLEFCFFVIPAYQGEEEFSVRTGLGELAERITATVQGIIAKYEGTDDLTKLRGYRDEICALSSYNDAAALGEVDFGDPWQLVWVFDGDPSTEVVCEGYSKAFQYLCDLSEFSQTIQVYHLLGMLHSSGMNGNHMWNLITMPDGRNYLADVTNCDEDMIGCAGMSLFLAPCTSGSVEEGYHFQTLYGDVSYTYLERTLALFPEEDLTVSSQPYTGPADPGGIPIDEEHFPDAAFRAYVAENLDPNQNGYLTDAEIARVTQIDCSGTEESPGEIASLEGLELFTELTELNCAYNQLTGLDLGKHPGLRVLYCGYNQLTSLDLRANPALSDLDCGNNQLTALDLAANPALQFLNCMVNRLSALNLSANPRLLALQCSGNRLSALDLSANTALMLLYCYENRLTALELSALPELRDLDCADNRLSRLKLSDNPQLIRLWCYNNQLRSLDLRFCPVLLEAAQGEGYALEGFPETALFYGPYQPYEDVPDYYDFHLAADKSVKLLVETPDGIPIDAEHFPDEKFRILVAEKFDPDYDGYLSQSEIDRVTVITCDYKNISSLQGIEYFTALTELYCQHNQLTRIELGANTRLNSLFCYNNQLENLDLSGCSQLYRLSCGSNRLTELDLRGNPGLSQLYCDYNLLERLELSGTAALTRLECRDNRLESLDLSGCTGLMQLYCQGNALGELDLRDCGQMIQLYCQDNRLESLLLNTASLTRLDCFNNQLGELDLSGSDRLARADCQNNRLTALTLDGCEKLERLACYGNELEGLDLRPCPVLVEAAKTEPRSSETLGEEVLLYGGSGDNDFTLAVDASTVLIADEPALPEGIPVDREHFPDEAFRAYVAKNLDQDGNAWLSEEEISQVTSIDCSGTAEAPGTIESLQGVEYFSALQSLRCSDNRLTGLDLSGNTQLRTLDCYRNQIASLNLRENGALTQLNAFENALTALDLSGNPQLTRVLCNGNQLTSLDLRANPLLEALYCHGNALTELDLSPCPVLAEAAKEEPTTNPARFGENVNCYGEYRPFPDSPSFVSYKLVVDASVFLTTEKPQDTLLGDANGDGKVNGKDLIILRRYVAQVPGTEIDQANSDLNGDGTVNGKDLILLRRLLAG